MAARPTSKKPIDVLKAMPANSVKSNSPQTDRQQQSEISRLSHEVKVLAGLNRKLQATNEQLRLEVAGLGRLLSQSVEGSIAKREKRRGLKPLGKKIEREVRRVRNRIFGPKIK